MIRALTFMARFWLVIAACIMYLPPHAGAYEVNTHERLTEEAAKQSDIEEFLALVDLSSLDDPLVDIETKLSILNWIRLGANEEDDNISTNFLRYRHHFFDTQHGGRGLVAGAVRGEPSPDWALEDTRTFVTQSYSFREARQYFYDALTLEDNREQWMARTFYTLGHVIHHIQDMAQPQHTRNDSHGGVVGFGDKSRYERHIDENRDELTFADQYYNADDPVHFDSARRFWITGDGRGMAEFSSHNFVSFGTNFRGALQGGLLVAQPNESYPLPAPDPVTPVFEDANALLASVGKPVPPECSTGPCEMAFYSSEVTDSYRLGAGKTNPRASTASIFDQDLERYGKTVPYPNLDRCSKPGNTDTCEQIRTNRIFSLNRFNFDAASEFLIPRAVAYSAGLIDYFFRGRLEAEDVELTDTGIRLRVKNAIDPVETPAWKDEILYAQTTSGGSSQFVVAYEYKDGAGSVHYGSSSPVAVIADIAPGQVSSARYDFQISVPAEARDVKYRLVFRGKLGGEEDAVAVGQIELISGFLVTPNYLPDDGIEGRRMIVNSGGQWRLSEKEGPVAGEIDWKGWYVGDRPTKVLSWHGPNARYFPNENETFVSMFRRQIYQNGEVLAVAPHRVLGAALLKGADNAEWLVAICHDGSADIVYRRPATQSDSPALYHPVHEPDGWLEIGRLSGEPYLGPDRPWFFNSSGTAAQTLRGARKSSEEADIPGTKLIRLEAMINVDTAAFKEIDNLGPLVMKGSNIPERSSTKSRVGNYDVWTYEGGRTYSWSESGEYIVAVDYKKDEPVECRLIVDNRYAEHLTATATKEWCRSESCIWDALWRFSLESVETTERVRDERLRCGTVEVPVNREHDQTKSEARSLEVSGLTSAHGESSVAYEYSLDLSRGFLSAADLRHDLMATSTFSEKHQYSEAATGDGFYSGPGRCDYSGRVNGNGHGMRDYRNVVDVRFKGDLLTAYERADSDSNYFLRNITVYDPATGGCIGIEETWESRRFPELPELYISGRDGAWRVDGAENILISQEVPDGFFNYISGGNLGQIVPTGSADARYYPLFVIR